MLKRVSLAGLVVLLGLGGCQASRETKQKAPVQFEIRDFRLQLDAGATMYTGTGTLVVTDPNLQTKVLLVFLQQRDTNTREEWSHIFSNAVVIRGGTGAVLVEKWLGYRDPSRPLS